MNHVQQLLRQKRLDVAARKKPITVPEDDRRLRWGRNHFRLIAEIKRASLSAGSIRKDLDPISLAQSYEHAGVAAISVLTEEHYFGGSLDDLRQIRKAVSVPLLQKDFVIDEFQILEAKEAGADFILLIVRFLEAQEVRGFLNLCNEIKLNAIVEITNEKDLEKLDSQVDFLGVNSRDLETLKIDMSKFARLRNHLPDAFLIAESGISNEATLNELMDLDYHGALVGEHLLRAADPEKEAAHFVRATHASPLPKVKICGITNEQDAKLAIGYGAKALGFIFADSPRRVDVAIMDRLRRQVPAGILSVGVFRGQSQHEVSQTMHRFSLDVAQVYEPMELDCPIWHVAQASNLQSLTDSLDLAGRMPGLHLLWDIKAADADLPEIWQSLGRREVFALAGGLHSENVGRAIQLCRPQWVDVARGVEHSPGIKDENKLLAFMKAVGATHASPLQR